MNHGHIVAIGTSDEIIEEHGSGERLEIHGNKKLADYIKANTELKVDFDGKNLISIVLNQKIDALAALAAAEQSGLDWGEIHTRRDSLDDVFVKLVSGVVDEHGEIRAEQNTNDTGNKRGS
jgi:ABC-type multidrug transport system ATPase subunit